MTDILLGFILFFIILTDVLIYQIAMNQVGMNKWNIDMFDRIRRGQFDFFNVMERKIDRLDANQQRLNVMVKEVLLVAAGGAVGSAMRYLVGKVAGQLFTGSFPVGTFIANIVGSVSRVPFVHIASSSIHSSIPVTLLETVASAFNECGK
jgi:hypothetical protein